MMPLIFERRRQKVFFKALFDCELDHLRAILQIKPHLLVNMKDPITHWLPLIWASWNGNLEAVEILVSHGAAVDIRDNHGFTPLFEATRGNHASTVQFLLNHGASINTQNNYGCTALLVACVRNHASTVHVLLDHGADANIGSGKGSTPLLGAFNHPSMVELLLQHGADANARDTRNGNTPLFVAIEWDCTAVLRLLLKFGADIDIQNKVGNTPLFHAIEWNRRADVDITSRPIFGTKRHQSTQNSQVKIMEILVHHGASVNVKNKLGDTPLDWAMVRGSSSSIYLVQWLLGQGADVNARNAAGETPLWRALKHCIKYVAHILVEHGADIHAPHKMANTTTTTPFVYACCEMGDLSLIYSMILANPDTVTVRE
jgi:ankyrin repeat protein